MGLSVRLDPGLSFREVFKGLFAGSKPSTSEPEPPSPEMMKASLEDVDGWLSIKLRTGTCTKLLKEQLALHGLALGELNAGLRYYFQPYDIFTVIENIESNRHASEKPFTGALRGLYHAHHSKASFIAENALRNWDWKVRQSGISEHEYMEHLATELFQQRMAKGISQDEAAKNLMAEIGYKELISGIEGPFNKTGEWLIYAEDGGRNIYLTLAFHTEGDANILNKLEPCYQEFPSLRNIVGVRDSSNPNGAV